MGGYVGSVRSSMKKTWTAYRAGDILVTSGLSQIYPKGIKIGTISALSREESGLLYTVSVQPAVDFDSLEEVLVITSYTASVASSEAD